MRLMNVETFKLEEFSYDAVPTYAILSHTWGKDNEEVSFRDVQQGKFEEAETRPIKIGGCCKQAKEDGHRYIWIDTCCIDKANAVELHEAINSMFQWYRGASICYAYLSDVPADDIPRDPGSKFMSSRWFTRGWTLQELLASKNLRFYDSEWHCLGSKGEMCTMVESITGISRPFLLGIAELHDASVAQRMSWAARRVTKRKEDTAYCLLGIFSVTMPMIYGEGNKAFRRLQEEIMRDIGDDSILAWGLDRTNPAHDSSIEVLSGGILAAAPSDFANCGQIISRERSANNSFDMFAGRVRAHLPFCTTSSGITYGLLNCGPEYHPEQVVAIPLVNVIPTDLPNQYVRPQGYCSILLPKKASEGSPKLIHIHREPTGRGRTIANRQSWFYIEQLFDTDLELIGVTPRDRWQKDQSVITTANDPDGNSIQRTLARFRSKGEGFYDFILVLEFEASLSPAEARCHLMISSRDTSLELLSQNLIHLRRDTLGQQSASNGLLNIAVSVHRQPVAGHLMFIVKLAAISSLPEVTVNATVELQVLDMKLDLRGTMEEKNRTRLLEEQLRQQTKEKMAEIEPKEKRLAAVQEKLKELEEERRLLVDNLKKHSLEAQLLTTKSDAIKQRQEKLSDQISATLRGLDNLHENHHAQPSFEKHHQTLLFCTAADGFKEIFELLFERRVDIELRDKSGRNRLSRAAGAGHEAMVQLLLDKGAAIEAKDNDGETPLFWAARAGHEAVVQLLLDKGAIIEAENKYGYTPLFSPVQDGHEAVVQLLLDKGAAIDAKVDYGTTLLFWAAQAGHKAIVQLLLDKGAAIEAKNDNGVTTLFWAAQAGQEAVVQLLLDKGAAIEAKDDNSATPLFWAAQAGREAVVQLLLDKGADVEAKDNLKRTSLSFAAKNGYDKVMMTLVTIDKINLESKDHYGLTPLSIGARNGHINVVQRLLNTEHVNIDSRDCFERTPLWYARRYGHSGIVQLLRENAKMRGISLRESDLPLEAGSRPYEEFSNWCNVCTLSLQDDDLYYECGICSGGSFVVCWECYNMEAHCLEVGHKLAEIDE